MTVKMALPWKCSAIFLCLLLTPTAASDLPLVINTWPFTKATAKAWQTITSGGSAMDAVVDGCTECELLQCDGTVGYGGSPDESGETTLDAMVMDGKTHNVGSVGDLRNVRNAVGVARAVMDFTEHTLLVGEAAGKFAIGMGFPKQSLETSHSRAMWNAWKANKCQPNYRKNVSPDPRNSCGPYHPLPSFVRERECPRAPVDEHNHDTIGMLVIDTNNNVVSGTSTNGMNHKVPGRVGDSPIVGSGSYASNGVGGAAATGDGDLMMRFLPSFRAIIMMEQGMTPQDAATAALQPIKRAYPTFSGAIVVANTTGAYGAACHNIQGGFHYSVRNPRMNEVTVEVVPCI